MACQKCKTFCLLSQQHSAQITVTQAYISLFRNGTRNTKRFQSDTDCFRCLGSGSDTFFQRNCTAQSICPACILKCNRLNIFYNFIWVEPFLLTKGARLFETGKAILGKTLFYFGNSSFFAFKHDIVSHRFCPPYDGPFYSSRGSIYFAAPS